MFVSYENSEPAHTACDIVELFVKKRHSARTMVF